MGQISTEDNLGAGLRGGHGDGAQVLPIRPGFGLIAPATTAPREGRASAAVEGATAWAAPFLHAERRSQPWEADGQGSASLDEVKVLHHPS